MIRKEAFVVLTGASSGIGFYLAKHLIEQYDCRVQGVARRAEKLAQTAAVLGSNFLPFAGDVSLPETWEKLAKTLGKQRVDVLIHCAGVMPPFCRADRQSAALTESVMRVNFLSSVYGTETLLPYLADDATVVEIASAAAVAPLIGTSAYAASKAASTAYFRALREEWRGTRQVTVVCPGFVKTDLFRDHGGYESSRRLLDLFAASPDKTAARILRKTKRGRSFAVLGLDGHVMSILSRLCPTAALRLFRRVIRFSKLPLFDGIFDE